jgi:hypothetical protein
MWNQAASIGVGKAGIDLLDYVKVIQDVLDASVVGQSIEEFPDLLLRGLHRATVPQPPRLRAPVWIIVAVASL